MAVALNDLIVADANNSGLVLDADLDSFYVMDSLAFRVPAAFSRFLVANSNYVDTTHSDTGATSDALIKANIGTQAVVAGELKSAADTIHSNVEASVAATSDGALEADLKPLVALSGVLNNEGCHSHQ